MTCLLLCAQLTRDLLAVAKFLVDTRSITGVILGAPDTFEVRVP